MSDNGAYEGEMNDVALFENALRAAVLTRPDPSLGTALVPRLGEMAQASTLEAKTRHASRRTAAPRSRLALVARVGIAVGLIPLVLAGLAVAGVTVPSPARSAFDSVGIHLPNQPPGRATSSHTGQGSSQSEPAVPTAGSNSATTKGNSGAAHQQARKQRAKAKGKANGHEQGKAVGLNDSTPPGQAKSKDKTKETGPPSHSNAGGNSASHKPTKTAPAQTTPTAPASGGKGNGAGNGQANGHTKSRKR